MSDEAGATLDTRKLDELVAILKGEMHRARVGVLGGKAARKEIGSNNAAIGAVHEYGGVHMPMRSFLRVPISENLQKAMDESGAFDEKAVKAVFAEKSFVPWLKKIAVVAEGVVAKAFATGGYGKWPAWKTPGYENNTGQILVDTQQLRNSITSDVK